MLKQTVKVDIVSDVVCPWCYIGKRRLENAMKQLSSEHDFEVEYHPFELNPHMPKEGVNHKEYLAEKFGGEEQYNVITARTSRVAAEEGLIFDFDQQNTSPNTRKAHALILLAKEENKQQEMVEALFKAYFSDGIDLSKDENLIDIAVNIGLDKDNAHLILTDNNTHQLIGEREGELQQLGIRGVPFYIINNQFGISGAQTSETFIKAFKEICHKAEVTDNSCNVNTGEC
jgi:predicted DsbA family dithiol-disulfide isomerase